MNPEQKPRAKMSLGYPPNIEQIRKAFPLKGREVFAWNGTIFNPSGLPIPPELLAHEETHFRQQAGDPDGWWDRYIEDPEFRLDQELEAHQVEYRVFCKKILDRNRRAQFLHSIAKRLSSPMYGGLIDFGTAMRLIRKGGKR